MTAEERFNLASRAAALLEQVQALREDVSRHYRDPGSDGFHVASGAWWALGPAESGLSRALVSLVDQDNLTGEVVLSDAMEGACAVRPTTSSRRG